MHPIRTQHILNRNLFTRNARKRVNGVYFGYRISSPLAVNPEAFVHDFATNMHFHKIGKTIAIQKLAHKNRNK